MHKRISKSSFEDEMTPSVDRVNAGDEISLVDLWLIIRRERLWLLAGLVVGVAVAFAYVTLAMPNYESRASIQIGKVPGPGFNTPVLIEDPGVLSVQLIDEYGPKSVKGTEQRVPFLETKGVKVRNNILDLVAVGYRPEEPRDLLTQIAAKVLQRHQQAYTTAIDPLRQRFTAIDSQIGILTTQMKELGDLIARLKEPNPTQASLVAIERGHLYTNLDQLERDRVILQQQTTTPYVNPSQLIAQPELPETPVSPRKLASLVIGIVLGLMLGLLAILFKGFIARVRRTSGSDVTRGV